MGLPVVAVPKTPKVIASILVSIGLLGLGLGQSANAQQKIHAIVCANSASLHLDRPVGDSVVTTSDVTLSGAVEQSNQLEVYIDNQLDSVIPLPVGAMTFKSVIQLAPGTHTIRLEAIDACQSKNATAAVVVTYQPAVTASTGSITPTQVEGGVVIGGTPPPAEVPAQSSPIERFLVEPLHKTADALDLIPVTETTSPAEMSPSVRLALVAGGAAIVTFSSALLGIDWINKLMQLAAVRVGLDHRYGAQVILGVVGLLVVAVAFLL